MGLPVRFALDSGSSSPDSEEDFFASFNLPPPSPSYGNQRSAPSSPSKKQPASELVKSLQSLSPVQKNYVSGWASWANTVVEDAGMFHLT